ncbi:MAG: hypothetical protein AAGF97_12330, partial [Planctomycetota bacterium]
GRSRRRVRLNLVTDRLRLAERRSFWNRSFWTGRFGPLVWRCDMATQARFKQPLRVAFIISVVVGACSGIVIVLRDTWGWYEVRVMMTTAVVAISSLCGLACDLSRTPAGPNRFPSFGLMLTLLTACLLLAGIWAEIESEAFWKSCGVLACFAIATVHVCLLSIARLKSPYHWVFLIAMQVIFGLACLVAIVILWELDEHAMWQVIAVFSILAAALTLLIPLLHRISRQQHPQAQRRMPVEERSLAAIDDELARLRDQLHRLEQTRKRLVDQETAGDDVR